MIKYKEFMLSELFDIVGTKSLDEGKLKFVKDGINFVGRVNENNGIKGKIKHQDFNPNEPFTITATVIGNYKYVKYQNEPYYCSQNINKLIPKFKINDKIAIYLIAHIQKFVSLYNGQQGGYKIEELKNHKIKLPIDKSGRIDFKYIEEHIEKGEIDCIKKINEYLKYKGLNNYELSDIEKKCLLKSPKTAEYKLEKLFIAQTGDVDLQQKDINGKGEYFINSGIENYGIKGKTDRKAKIFNENTITVDFWGIANYRSFKYKMATHNHVFSLSGDVIKNEKVGLYLVSKMKYFRKIFSYDNMGTWNKMKKMTIKLPINDDKEIDYEYMQNYITAIEKIVVKNLVVWKDNFIKEIV